MEQHFIAWGYAEGTDGMRDYSEEYYFTSEELAQSFIATLALDYTEVSEVRDQCGCLSDGDTCEGYDRQAWCHTCI